MSLTVTITDNLPGTANRTTASLVYSLAFSDTVTGLDANDFTISNGTVGTVAGTGTNWTVSVTPAQGVSSGTIGLTLKAGAVSDAAGNLNAATTNTSQAIDTVPPVAPKLVTNAAFNSLIDPQVTLQTSMGNVVLALYPEQAPATVANMLAYVNNGFYDGTLFHRVIPGFMAQGGGYTAGLAYKTPTYSAIPLESTNGLSNQRGTIAMARTTAPDSATSQFFINQVDNNFLNYTAPTQQGWGYAVFGGVLSGMSVVDSMVAVPRNASDVPLTNITITSAQQSVAGLSLANTATLTLSGLETGAIWGYSLDGGATWFNGAGTTLTVPVGSYAAGAIQVFQEDAAGNFSTTAGKFTSALVVQATTLTGTDVANTYFSAPGAESIDGKAGTDWVIYSSLQAAYTLTNKTVSYSVSGPDGNDTLVSVERLQFLDSNLAFDLDGNAGQTYRLYQAAFNRTPDIAGLGGWINGMDGGLTPTQVATSFMASAEFQSLYGANPSNEQFVSLLYTNALHRAADAGGLAYWVNQLVSNLQTRAQVLVNLSESPENKAAVLPSIAEGILYANANQAATLAKVPAFTGTAGDDNLVGSAGNDAINAVAGKDTITAGYGNDTLTGGTGNDTINGGDGLDTAIYSGKRATYTVVSTNGTLTVSGGTDGSDTLTHVERLKFEDITLAFDTSGNAGQTYRLYQAAFNRTPDQAGLSDWIRGMDGGLSLQKVASGFIASEEFKSLMGANATDSQFVDLMYTTVLHRAANQQEHDGWLGQMQGGSTRETVLIGFSESAENQAALIGVIQGGIEYLAV